MDFFWEKDGWEQDDPQLSRLRKSPFRREFPALNTSKGLFIIRGPRQIGKSSWLKTILSNWSDPKSAFYLSCEEIEDHKELSLILKGIRAQRKLILLDEISFVRDWARTIKHEIDSGYSGTIIVTGSHAADLRRGADQMPGRLAKGGDIKLLPMSFEEFSKMRVMAGWTTKKQSAEERTHELLLYFKIGGFPAAVMEAGPKGVEPLQAKEIYKRWLIGDAIKLGKQEVYLKETLSQIALTMTTPISLQKLAQRTQMGSHHTALDYVSLLEDAFALKTCYAIDPNTGAYRMRKEKKFYFCDPLIYWIALEAGGLSSRPEWASLLAEMVAHEALTRLSAGSRTRFGYFHSQNGEVDFYSKDHWAIEIKWALETRNLSKAFREINVPWKAVWTQQNFLTELPQLG